MFLAYVTHDARFNTLQATWLIAVLDSNGNIVEYSVAKNRNYSSDQKEEFLADCGDAGQKYVIMAGW